MAKGKAAGDIKVVVPRQNAQRLGPAVTNSVRSLVKREGKVVHLPPPVQESPNASSIAAAAESASEWNSLLLTARAERGPQWDVATQQFLVETGSVLYYDPTPLKEAALAASKAQDEQNQKDAGPSNQQNNPNDFMALSPNVPPGMQHRSFQGQPYPYHNNMQMPMTPGHPTQRGFSPGGPMNMQQGQFYGDPSTPTRMGMMDPTRRMTRGMTEEFGMYGN